VVRRAAVLLAAALATTAVAPLASADPAAEEHQVATSGNTYVPPEILIASGDTLTHTNFDAELHDLISDDLGPDGQPWFKSELIGFGESAPVPVAHLPRGVYAFYCSIHPFMRGKLYVDETPVPVPDPDPEVPGGGLPEPAVKGDVEIQSGEFFFTPKTLTIPVGTTVSWLNVGTARHTVTASDGTWDSSPGCPTAPTCHMPGERYRKTFDEPGVVSYYCKLHALPGSDVGHAGRIVVVEPGTEPSSVDHVGASVSGSRIDVLGSVTFRGEGPVTVAADPPGDGPGHPALAQAAGVDLIGARAYRPDPSIPAVFFEWRLADLPPGGALPEGVRYTLPFRIGAATYVVQAKRLGAASTTVPGDPQGHATHAGFAFQLRGNCQTSPAPNCGHVAWLTGSFDAERGIVRVKVPLGVTPAFVPGAALHRGQSSEPGQVRIRASYETLADAAAVADEAAWGDADASFAYVIAEPSVRLGLAPAGTPAGDVSFDAVAEVASDGSYTAIFQAPSPGAWDVWVRACFGTSCSTASRRVTI
jgi:plastocyanin